MNDQNTAPATMGERISLLRRRAELSQDALAERLGVSRQAVSKWETDQCAPDTYNLIALSRLLGASLEYIALGTQPTEALPTNLSDGASADTDAAKENTTPTDPTTPSRGKEKAAPSPTRRILGIIFLCVGLLSLLLGLLLMPLIGTAFLLLILAAYALPLSCILLCPVPQRLLGAVLSLALWVVSGALMCFTTGAGYLLPWQLFPMLGAGGFNFNVFFALILHAWGAANLGMLAAFVVRVIRTRQRK